ncbi:unnamed protein product [Fusarium graminearum]|nr:unnamed protein product [Fusarium graminearum]VTO91669.1 unnamed protein product [Fusarium graminearum]
MDPLSIATGCASLVTTIGGLTLSINSFVRNCREARSDLDSVSRELHSLETVLELIEEDAKDDTKPFPETIQRHVSGIVTNCGSVVVEIQTCITKYGDGNVRSKAAWVLNGQGDMGKLRSSLEAHKSALELALDMLTLSLTKDIKTDTTEIRNDTAAIKDDTAQILQEIAQLQARLPETAAAPNDFILQKFLEDMATYTETTLDVDGGFSDRASSKALSFIDECEESPRVSNPFDIPIRTSQNEDNIESNQVSHSPAMIYGGAGVNKADDLEHPKEKPFAKLAKRESLIKGYDADLVETHVASQRLSPSLRPTPRPKKLEPITLKPVRAKSSDYDYVVEQTSATTLDPTRNVETVLTNPRPDHVIPSIPQNLLSDKPRVEPGAELKNLSPEMVFRIAYSVHPFFNNFVHDVPVPEAILKAVPLTNEREFTTSRFTWVTCPPHKMVAESYCLRPTFYTTTPVTKFILLVVVRPLGRDLRNTWSLIHKAIAYAEERIGPETWKQIRVHIHIEWHISKLCFGFLKIIGAIEDFNIPAKPVRNKMVLHAALTQDTLEVTGKYVEGTIQESTVQLREAYNGESGEVHPADIPIRVVVTRGHVNYPDFSPWTRSIKRILDAAHIIDMDSLNSNIHRDHTFLYRAWTAKKPLATTNDSIGLIKFDDLVKQTRTFKERLLG